MVGGIRKGIIGWKKYNTVLTIKQKGYSLQLQYGILKKTLYFFYFWTNTYSWANTEQELFESWNRMKDVGSVANISNSKYYCLNNPQRIGIEVNTVIKLSIIDSNM